MFAAAMKTINNVTTWNGAKSYATPVPKVCKEDEPDEKQKMEQLLCLFYKSNRNADASTLKNWFRKVPKEKIEELVVLSFHVRDCRGGKGERHNGRLLFSYLAVEYPDTFSKVLHLIPDYGRYDDLLYLLTAGIPREAEILILEIIKKQTLEDFDKMNEGKTVSLLSKWMPTEGDSMDKKYNLVEKICSFMDIKKSTYRKKYISPLRSYLKVVETLMCSGRWDEIDFNTVPSCAMNKLKAAFERNVPESYNKWKEGLESGETKVNARQLYPYEIIRNISENLWIKDELAVAQWKVLEADAKKLGKLNKTVVVADVSTSMNMNNCLPLHNSIALG